MKFTLPAAAIAVMVLLTLVFSTAFAEEFDVLISALDHPDKQIREAAKNQLLDEKNDATPSLVTAVLDPTNRERLASAAAIVLVERLTFLKDRLNLADRTKPVVNLQQSDKQQLKPLVHYVRMSTGQPNWRWYLAVAILDDVDPPALLAAIPALNNALISHDVMRQYVAVKAIYHLAEHEQAKQTKASLLNLLYRHHSPFYGLFLRGNRLLDENLLSYALDVRAYDDIDTQDAYFRRETYYSHGDLLITATLVRLGATYEEIGPRLVDLATRYDSSTRLHAARQLAKLGANAQRAAAVSLAQMLTDHDQYLLRRIADEHPSFVGSVSVDNPQEQLKTIVSIRSLGQSSGLVVAPLTGILNDADVRVRHVAARLLAEIGKYDRALAIDALQKAIGQEIAAPLASLLNADDAEVAGKAATIFREISEQRKVVSIDTLKSIRENLAFDNPRRESQQACFNAMLNALVQLQTRT